MSRTTAEQNEKEADLISIKTGAGSEWLKKFNDRNDLRYKNFSDTRIEEMYYNLMEQMQIASENKNYKKAFAEAIVSLPLIKRFIQIQYSKYNGFYIKGIPAIDFCLEYCSSTGLTGIVENVAEIIKGHPELSSIYSDDLEQFQEISVIARSIRKILAGNPEIRQNTLHAYFPETGTSTITGAVYYMEEFGLIERVREGTTYTLKLVAAATSTRDRSSSNNPGTARG